MDEFFNDFSRQHPAFYCLVIGLLAMLVGYWIYWDYKKQGYKPNFGEQENFNAYFNEWFRMAVYYRSFGIMFIGLMFFLFGLYLAFFK